MNKNIVEKSNILNTIRSKTPDEEMSLNELRLFCMYLSKLNAREPEKRKVEIPIKEFEELFDVKFNSALFTKKIRKALKRSFFIREGKRMMEINLYSYFAWSEDNYNTLEIACNSDVVPYLFELKNCYTSYRLENIAKLNSVAKIRLYELCKQYENIAEFKIELEELQETLFSHNKDFRYFRHNLLDPAIDDINKNTDIIVRYDKILKMRKVVALKFHIEKRKKNQPAPVTEEPVPTLPPVQEKKEPKSLHDLYLKYFTNEQIEMLKNTIEISMFKYSDKQKNEVLEKTMSDYSLQALTTAIKAPYSYMCKILAGNIQAYLHAHKPRKNASYDIEEIERFAINHKELQEIED